MKSFRHSGDLGDVIFALASMSAMGGGKLYLSVHPGTRVPMGQVSLNLLAPLLERQPYVKAPLELHTGQSCWVDLDAWRIGFTRTQGFKPTRPLAECCSEELGLKPFILEHIWLTHVIPSEVAPVIINRTDRYRNPDFPWGKVLEKYAGKIAFIGMPEEHSDFETRFGSVLYYPTKDLYEVAQVIAGSRLFLGNQSCANAIAEAMKHNLIQEVYLRAPDCIFPRANAQHVAGGWIDLPEI